MDARRESAVQKGEDHMRNIHMEQLVDGSVKSCGNINSISYSSAIDHANPKVQKFAFDI